MVLSLLSQSDDAFSEYCHINDVFTKSLANTVKNHQQIVDIVHIIASDVNLPATSRLSSIMQIQNRWIADLKACTSEVLMFTDL